MNLAASSDPLFDGRGTDAPLRIEMQGIEIELAAPEPVSSGLRERLGASAIPCLPAARSAVRYRLASIDDDGVRFERADGLSISGYDVEAALDRLADHLHDMIANRSTAGLFVHAAVFSIADRLVIVPGRSQAGKSTLVAGAVARGATYYSDEYAVIDANAMVHPYPRPISLRTPHGSSRRHPQRDLGGHVATSAARAALVLVTTYEPAASWRPERLVGSRAALPIIANTIHARRLAESTMRLAARIAHETLVLAGPRGEAESMLGDLEDLVRSLPEPMARTAHEDCA